MTGDSSPNDARNITAAVLAAGASSRMGRHKLLLPLGGKPLIAWSVLAACASRASDVLVIVGRDASDVQSALPPGRYRVLVNADFERGQGSSLALAVSSAPPDAAGLLVLLADQPFMDSESVDRVLAVAQREPGRIILGGVAGRVGHPVYLPRRVFAEASALTADKGARDIIAAERVHTRIEPLANDLAHFDVDTVENYQQALGLAYRLRSPAS
jgi:molybdenum cofactor cytidylyltransferase